MSIFGSCKAMHKLLMRVCLAGQELPVVAWSLQQGERDAQREPCGAAGGSSHPGQELHGAERPDSHLHLSKGGRASPHGALGSLLIQISPSKVEGDVRCTHHSPLHLYKPTL